MVIRYDDAGENLGSGGLLEISGYKANGLQLPLTEGLADICKQLQWQVHRGSVFQTLLSWGNKINISLMDGPNNAR